MTRQAGTEQPINKSAIRTLRVLEDLAQFGPSRLGEVAERTSWSKSTTHRFLRALTASGFVRQEMNGGPYQLTTRLIGLAGRLLESMDVRTEVRPVLQELARATGETVHLGILEDLEVVYVDKVEGGQAVRMASRIGLRGTCHSTALGKILLAAEPESEWERYVQKRGLARRTPRTITSPGNLFEELRRVRAQGYAIDNVENEDGIRCIAAPLRDHEGRTAAALSVSGWTLSMTPGRVSALQSLIVSAADAASRRLGHWEQGGRPEQDVSRPARA